MRGKKSYVIHVAFMACIFLLTCGTASSDKGWYYYHDVNTISEMTPVGDTVLCVTTGGLIGFHPGTGEADRYTQIPCAMIQVARDGTVWMVAGGTLGTFANGAFHAVSGEEAPPSGIVMNITAAPDTTLWVGTNNGLYRLRGSVWSRFDFTANVIKFVAADGHGQAWISTGEGIERFDGASWSHVDFDNNVITSLVVDGIGRVWAAGRNNPIRKAVPSSDSIVNVRDTGTSGPAEKPAGDPYYTKAIYLDDGSGFKPFITYGNDYDPNISLAVWKEDELFVWKWSIYGVSQFNYIHGTDVTPLKESVNLPKSITSFSIGPDDTVWFGTSGGIFQLTRNSSGFAAKTFTIADGLPSNNVLSVAVTPDGKIIAGTEAGIGVYAGNKWTSTRFPGILGSTFQCAVRDPDGAMWFGSDLGISRFLNGSWTNYSVKDGIRAPVNCMWLDAEDRLWYAGTDNGGIGCLMDGKWKGWWVGRMNGRPVPMPDGSTWVIVERSVIRFTEKGPSTVLSGDQFENMRSMEPAADGTVWVCAETFVDGVNLYNCTANSTTHVAYMGGTFYSQMKTFPDGTLWMCSAGKSVRYKDGVWTAYSDEEGLPQGDKTLLMDNKGGLWSKDNGYLYSFDGTRWNTVALLGNGYRDSYSVYFDSENNFWITAPRNDVILRYDGERLYQETPAGGYGIPGLDQLGRFFFVSAAGAAFFSSVTWTVLPNEMKLSPALYYNVCYIDAYRGEIWYSTSDGGLVRYVGDEFKVEGPLPIPVSVVCGNHPNPFNGSTTIDFTLPKDGSTTVTIFSITGQMVRRLHDDPMETGSHSVVWDGRNAEGRNVASGIYFAGIRAAGHWTFHRMMVLR